MKTKTALVLLLCGAAAGCTAPPTQQDRYLAAGPLVCTDTAQCKAYWARAQSWIVQNSRYTMQVVSDTVISTATPEESSAYAGFSATKMPQPDGSEHITLQPICRNPYGCGQATATMTARFKTFVQSN